MTDFAVFIEAKYANPAGEDVVTTKSVMYGQANYMPFAHTSRSQSSLAAEPWRP